MSSNASSARPPVASKIATHTMVAAIEYLLRFLAWSA
jgi:hypothetical protein